MNMMLSTDATAAHVGLGVRNDVTVELSNSSMTVTQIQAALTKISNCFGTMAAAGSSPKQFEGHSGTSS